MYQTVIVEDEPSISQLHKAFLARDPRFQLVRSFSNGHDALSWLLLHPVDLIILDVFMPRMTGLELLRSLRGAQSMCDVIMVTAANDHKTVDALLKLGVTDYLVKPFAAARFQQALDTFCQHRAAIDGHDSVSQQDLDAFLAPPSPAAGSVPSQSPTASEEPVPKGLQAKTLALMRDCLSHIPASGSTCETLAASCGLSTVTVRRYLTYLVQHGEAISRVNYDTGGRPSMLYFRLERS